MFLKLLNIIEEEELFSSGFRNYDEEYEVPLDNISGMHI